MGYQRECGDSSEDYCGENEPDVRWGEGDCLDQGDHGEWEIGCEEERKTLREKVVPIIAAVENGEVLIDVEIEPLIWWEGQFSEIVVIRHS